MAVVDKIIKTQVDLLEKMSDADIELHFADQLNITRPSLRPKTSPILTRADATPMKYKSSAPPSAEKQAKIDRARLIAEKFGVDIKDLM